MGAKELILRPISSKEGNAVIKKLHYSGKVVQNSQLHIGAFWRGRLEGALQFGPSMRKDLMLPLVRGTPWSGCLELNRMAFSDRLPRNSESRAIGVAMRMLRKYKPIVQWVVSFADGTQCGDGTIYRAAGFVLTGIKKNTQMRVNPETGLPMQSMAAFHKCRSKEFKTWDKLPGFQLRYIYFLDPTARERLTVPILPFSEIQRRGAGMYLGEKRAGSDTGDTSSLQDGKGGSIPTSALTKISHA